MTTALVSDGLTVHTQSHDYPIVIVAQDDTATSNMAEQIAAFINGKQLLIVTNDTVAPLYLAALQAQLEARFTVAVCILPDGEVGS